MGQRCQQAVRRRFETGKYPGSEMLRPDGADQSAQGIAGQVEVRRNAGRQPVLQDFHAQAQPAGQQRGQAQGGETPGQTAQCKDQKEPERQIDGDIGSQVEGGPVFGPAGVKEGQQRDAQILPAAERVQAAVDDQPAPGQRQVTGENDGAPAMLGHGGILGSVHAGVSLPWRRRGPGAGRRRSACRWRWRSGRRVAARCRLRVRRVRRTARCRCRR